MRIIEDLAPEQHAVIIPCEVFAETVNILGKKFGHVAAIEAVEIILNESGLFVVEDSGRDIRRAALDWFGSLHEGVSYTDCIATSHHSVGCAGGFSSHTAPGTTPERLPLWSGIAN